MGPKSLAMGLIFQIFCQHWKILCVFVTKLWKMGTYFRKKKIPRYRYLFLEKITPRHGWVLSHWWHIPSQSNSELPPSPGDGVITISLLGYTIKVPFWLNGSHMGDGGMTCCLANSAVKAPRWKIYCKCWEMTKILNQVLEKCEKNKVTSIVFRHPTKQQQKCWTNSDFQRDPYQKESLK